VVKFGVRSKLVLYIFLPVSFARKQDVSSEIHLQGTLGRGVTARGRLRTTVLREPIASARKRARHGIPHSEWCPLATPAFSPFSAAFQLPSSSHRSPVQKHVALALLLRYLCCCCAALARVPVQRCCCGAAISAAGLVVYCTAVPPLRSAKHRHSMLWCNRQFVRLHAPPLKQVRCLHSMGLA
jgi:hypothetical protein